MGWLILFAILLGISLISLAMGVPGIFGSDYLEFVLFLTIFITSVLGIYFYAWPKQGALYASRNRSVARGLFEGTILLLGLSGIGAIVFFHPGKNLALLAAGCFLWIGIMILVGRWRNTRTVSIYGLEKLEKIFQPVAQSIRSFKKPGERIGRLFPKMIVDGKSFFAAEYRDWSGLRLNGLLFLDEKGKPVTQENLQRKLGKCRYLALMTIDGAHAAGRAKETETADRSARTMSKLFRLLRSQKPYFIALGAEAAKDWGTVLEAEEASGLVFELTRRSHELEAEWGVEQGGTRMKECRYEDLEKLEARVRGMMKPRWERHPRIIRCGEAALRLRESNKRQGTTIPSDTGSITLHRVFEIQEFLDILCLLGKEIGKLGPAYERPGLHDEEWQALRARLKYVQELEKGKIL